MRSIHVGLSGFLKQVFCLTRFFKLQRFKNSEMLSVNILIRSTQQIISWRIYRSSHFIILYFSNNYKKLLKLQPNPLKKKKFFTVSTHSLNFNSFITFSSSLYITFCTFPDVCPQFLKLFKIQFKSLKNTFQFKGLKTSFLVKCKPPFHKST